MIDQKINKSLNDLEHSLIEIQSAKQQVEMTISAYNDVNIAISSYVKQLDILTDNAQALINRINDDYNQKASKLNQDSKAIMEAFKTATEQLSDANISFKNSLTETHKKLKLYLYIIIGTFVGLLTVLFLLIK